MKQLNQGISGIKESLMSLADLVTDPKYVALVPHVSKAIAHLSEIEEARDALNVTASRASFKGALRPSQIASLRGCRVETVRRAIQAGELSAFSTPRGYVVPEEDARRWRPKNKHAHHN